MSHVPRWTKRYKNDLLDPNGKSYLLESQFGFSYVGRYQKLLAYLSTCENQRINLNNSAEKRDLKAKLALAHESRLYDFLDKCAKVGAIDSDHWAKQQIFVYEIYESCQAYINKAQNAQASTEKRRRNNSQP